MSASAAADSGVQLVRRWAVDWLAGRHPEVCEQILAPGYALLIGGYLLGPRETYVPATLEQLARYPGLGLTVHRLVAGAEHVAIEFSEHGASVRLEGREASWSGVAVFRHDGAQLTHCWAEEDYAGRRRQLASGTSDPVAPPAVAPWDVLPGVPDPTGEEAVRAWLARPDLRSAPVVCDDEPFGRHPDRLLDVEDVEVHALFSSGPHVAFAATQTGRHLGGLADDTGQTVRLGLAGIVQTDGGAVVGGRVVRDRLGAGRGLS